jgi:hypothetical protein
VGRRASVLTLATVVTAAHLAVVERIDAMRLGQGSGSHGPAKLQVAFVKRLEPSAAPARPPEVRPVRASAAGPSGGGAAARPQAAASAAADSPTWKEAELPPEAGPVVAPAAEPLVTAEAPEAPQPVPTPDLAAPDAAASAGPGAPAPSAPAFEWPLSTRLRYTLTGQVRGPVEGQASVEWLRVGRRYQVHLEVSVGPHFAPLVRRTMVSDGELTEAGLVPRRYDEATHIALREPRRLTLSFNPLAVVMADGRLSDRPQGVQDSASQFVQLTWMFTMRPELLAQGSVIEMPLALPRRVEPWHYEVLSREGLDTAAGTIEAVHVKPRRQPRPGGDLVAEAWFAPSLQYLPVRIVIRQDSETWIDLTLAGLPEQAGSPEDESAFRRP